MNSLISMFQTLIPDATKRVWILKGARWASALVAGFVLDQLTKQGMNATDAAAIATAVGGVALAVVSALGSYLDGQSVKKQIASATVQGAVLATSTPEATQAVTAASGSPEALQQVIAKLKAA